MKAKTLEQVIAAEAGGKTRAQRLADMKNIYSSMVNRAKATGVSIKDVFAKKSQYNAYNAKMPAGTPNLVGLAAQAVSYVDTFGVTHPGLYYATPAAVNNLPKGLVEVPGVGGVHKVFVDPKNRAVVTAAGVKPVGKAAASALPASIDVPASRPASPADIAAAYSDPSRAATPEADRALSAAMGRLAGAMPYEAPAARQSPISPDQALSQLAMPSAERFARSMPSAPVAAAAAPSAPPSAERFGSAPAAAPRAAAPIAERFGQGNAAAPFSPQSLNPVNAVASGVMAPSPQATNNSGIDAALRAAMASPADSIRTNPSGNVLTASQQLASAAAQPSAQPPMGSTAAPKPAPAPAPKPAPAAPATAVASTLSALSPVSSANAATAPVDKSVAPLNPGQLGGIRMPTQVTTTPPTIEQLNAALAALPAPQQVVDYPVATVAPAKPAATAGAFPAAPPPRPAATAMDVYRGNAATAMDNTKMNTISSDIFGGTSVTNKYGVTTYTTPDGKQAAGAPRAAATPAAPNSLLDLDPLSGGGLSKGLGQVGAALNEKKGSLLGALIGGLLAGPAGVAMGAKLGNTAQHGLNPNSALANMLGKGTNSFLDAPTGIAGAPKDPRDSNNSMGGMRDISPGAADAISKGVGGLY